jgi:hypothetical protein
MEPSATRAEPGSEPNVLLVVLDTVTARHTSLYGHHAETTRGLTTNSSAANRLTPTP